jgi:triacylglycerol esterase/lipase EstA (alpha/beta hydrolase family)
MSSGPHHIFLVPGFFGFANLGDLKYFGHVEPVIHGALKHHGIDARIHHVRTLPTASVRKRATRLLQFIAESSAMNDGGPIHLVGHSSGGLDARLLVAAGASLHEALPADAIAARVLSVTSVCSPHYGTPMVSVFTTVVGPRLLQVLSLATMYVLRYGRLPLGVLLPMGKLLVRLDNVTGADPLDQLYDELLADFGDERQRTIREFFAEVGQDQSLIGQLMPEGMDVFNATTRDCEGVHYGCVIARARPPGVASTMAAGFGAYAQASHAFYVALSKLASRMPHDKAPMPTFDQVQAMRRAWGDVPGLEANDGIVPVLSQLWGEVVAAVTADHHDVIGHFDDTDRDPPHYDWLQSGSKFGRGEFEGLWSDVGAWIARRARAGQVMPTVRGQPSIRRRRARLTIP